MGVFQFLDQQLDRSLLDDDLLLGQQHIVISGAHLEQAVGYDCLVLQQALLSSEPGSTPRRADTPAFINRLHQTNVARPLIPRRTDRSSGFSSGIAEGKLFHPLDVGVVTGPT